MACSKYPRTSVNVGKTRLLLLVLLRVQERISVIIIQQIVTLSKHGHDALDIRNRYPAVYVALYVGRKREVRKCRQRDLQGFRLFCYQFVE